MFTFESSASDELMVVGDLQPENTETNNVFKGCMFYICYKGGGERTTFTQENNNSLSRHVLN